MSNDDSDIYAQINDSLPSASEWLAIMPAAKLKYSLNAVKRAGKVLRDTPAYLVTPPVEMPDDSGEDDDE